MSWHPSDLVADADLKDYEADILKYGASSWESKRTKALEDWLFPILKANGYDPFKFRTRYESDGVQGYTASAYTDYASAARNTTDDDINLATVFASISTDALYVGSTQPFRGLFIREYESNSSASGVMTVSYFNGAWQSLQISDGTIATAGKTLSRGGSVVWKLPTDWMWRKVNSVGPYYWAKVTLSATPTSAKATQIAVIRQSSLRAPAIFRTLQLIFQEAPTTSGQGPWAEKAAFYAEQADLALQRAIPAVAGEFDTDASDLVGPDEAAVTQPEVTQGFILERY